MYNKPDWAVRQVIRYDRNNMVEDICIHGVGHPNSKWLEEHPDDIGLHCCCGCCQPSKERFGKSNKGR